MDWGEYRDVVKTIDAEPVEKARFRQLEQALGDSLPKVMRRCLRSNNGSKRPAMRKFNDRLRNTDRYDHDEHGVVSPNTWYDLIDKYRDHLNDVL